MIQFPKINGSFRENDGVFVLPDTLSCDPGGFDDYCLNVFAERLGLSPGQGNVWLHLKKDTALAEEGYRLTVKPDGIFLHANTEQGVIHGLTTLYLRCDGRNLRACQIIDAPVYSHRGQSLDCVRHFFPAEEVKRILEQMSLVKMNVLHFHLTDDQGWRIESRKFPELHRTGQDYYTQEQLRDIVEFARTRGIEVVPEIDLPGHTTAILAAYPELGCTGVRPALATQGGIYHTILCAGQEKVYRFLEELLAEICPIFPTRRFHIGGDEAPKRQWESCPVCRQKLRALGSDDFEDLQSHFTLRVAEILKQNGKRPICWNETLKGNRLPEDIQIQYWTSECMDSMKDYIRQGGQYIYSSMYELYLDYPYGMTDVRKLYRMTPRIGSVRCTKHNGMLGIESTLWTEHISTSTSLEEHLFPRLYIAAEKAWSGGHNPYRIFLADLERLCAMARREGLMPMDSARWNPTGKERQRQALEFFTKMNGSVPEESVPENLEKANPGFRLMYDYVTKFFRLRDLPALARLYFK